MAYKAILFNGDMVTATLEGSKSETRRPMKNQNILGGTMTAAGLLAGIPEHPEVGGEVIKPPYDIGDILWVRETWQEVYETEFNHDAPGYCVNIKSLIPNFDDIPKIEAGISSDSKCAAMVPRMKYYVFKSSNIQYASSTHGLLWKPNIHMPKQAARLFLKVNDISIQRVQDITSEEIAREGVWIPGCLLPTDEFAKLWDSTISEKKRDRLGWNANPWVWVVKFEKCEMPKNWNVECNR